MIETKPPRPEDAKRAAALHWPPDWTWRKVDGHCFACGRRDLWQSSEDGEDYYHGCSAVCHSCGHDMCCVGKVEEGRT